MAQTEVEPVLGLASHLIADTTTMRFFPSIFDYGKRARGGDGNGWGRLSRFWVESDRYLLEE